MESEIIHAFGEAHFRGRIKAADNWIWGFDKQGNFCGWNTANVYGLADLKRDYPILANMLQQRNGFDGPKG